MAHDDENAPTVEELQEREIKELQGKLANAYAANNALGSSGMERDEVMTRLVKESEEWKQKAEECEGRAGVLKMDPILALQNHKFRKALQAVNANQPWASYVMRDALALTPTATEKRVGAMEKVCEALGHLEPGQFTAALEDAWEEFQEAEKV